MPTLSTLGCGPKVQDPDISILASCKREREREKEYRCKKEGRATQC